MFGGSILFTSLEDKFRNHLFIHVHHACAKRDNTTHHRFYSHLCENSQISEVNTRRARHYFAKFHGSSVFYYSITDFGSKTRVNVDDGCARVFARSPLKRFINQNVLDSLLVSHKSRGSWLGCK